MNRILSTLSLLGGIFWIIIPFFPPVCAPVTEASEVLCNRLWSPALLSMLLGFVGLFLAKRPTLTRAEAISLFALVIGFTMMFMGNFVEYWMLNDLPHQGPAGLIRGLSWMTVLVGFLVALVASVTVGVFGFKTGHIPRWLSVLFLMLFPVTLVTGFVRPMWIGIPIGVLSISVGFWGLLSDSSRIPQARSV